MPHQCTGCARVFADGSKEMLGGCPDCGGTTFQYHSNAADAPSDPGGEEAAEPPSPPERPADSSVARTVGNAATTVRDLVSSSPDPPAFDDGPGLADDGPELGDAAADGVEAPADGVDATADSSEDAAQASARSELVSPDELPAASAPPTRSRPTPVLDERTDPPKDAVPPSGDGDRPDLADLRAELNDQFESIKVVEPGQYELNLMSLYDREEYIIALQEDGKYTIQMPERWTEDGD